MEEAMNDALQYAVADERVRTATEIRDLLSDEEDIDAIDAFIWEAKNARELLIAQQNTPKDKDNA